METVGGGSMRKCPLCEGGYIIDGRHTCECGFCSGTGGITIKEYMRYVRAHRKVENWGVKDE